MKKNILTTCALPWHEENFRLFSFLGMSSEERIANDNNIDNHGGWSSGYIAEVGQANIATFLAKGKDLFQFKVKDFLPIKNLTMKISYTEIDGVYFYETAAISNFDELTNALLTYFPSYADWTSLSKTLKKNINNVQRI